MFAVIQFPIADGRRFVEPAAPDAASAAQAILRFKKPNFANLRTTYPADYVRCFGRAVKRRRGVYAAWVDEGAFCRADGALRFVDFQEQLLGEPPIRLTPACIFRRLFSDGAAVTRVEIGVRAPKTGSVLGLTGAQAEEVAGSFMHLQTKVRLLRPTPAGEPAAITYQAPMALARQGSHLAKLYRSATAKGDVDRQLARLVQHGDPLVLLEFDSQELKAFPDRAQVVDPHLVGGAGLAFKYLPVGRDDRVATWFIRRDGADDMRLRNLRLCLLRLHAQRTVLDLILSQILNEFIPYHAGTEAGERLKKYLNEAITLVQKPTAHGVSQAAVQEALDAADLAIAESAGAIELAQGAVDREHLRARLDEAGQVVLRVQTYVAGTRGMSSTNINLALVDVLVRLQFSSEFKNRGLLLESIPEADTFDRSEGNRRADLAHIVNQVAELRWEAPAKRPLVVLIDNALPFADGAEDRAKLEAIKAAASTAA